MNQLQIFKADLEELKTYLNRAIENITDPIHGDSTEAVDYINDALSKIKRMEEI